MMQGRKSRPRVTNVAPGTEPTWLTKINRKRINPFGVFGSDLLIDVGGIGWQNGAKVAPKTNQNTKQS